MEWRKGTSLRLGELPDLFSTEQDPLTDREERNRQVSGSNRDHRCPSFKSVHDIPGAPGQRSYSSPGVDTAYPIRYRDAIVTQPASLPVSVSS